MGEYTNRVRITNSKKEGDKITILGAFSCGINFPKDGGSPFKKVKMTSKNGKEYTRIRGSVVLSPDNKKGENGLPLNGVYIEGVSKTLLELLTEEGVELFNGKLYASVLLPGATEGLYQVLSDKDLSFKTNILICGELTTYKGNDGKIRTSFQNVTFFGKDHVFDDIIHKENALCMCSDDAPKTTTTTTTETQTNSSSNDVFYDIEDDDEIPF